MANANKFNIDGTIINVEDAAARNPTFTEASTRANIASGESLSTLFGKIKKFFTDLKTVAFTGSYTDLSNKPTIPTVNNATLTIQKNGTNVQTFTANASANKTANITVPTKVSELENDSGYITNAGVTGVKGNSETTYRTGNVNITKANIGLGSVGNFKAVSTAASQGLTNTEKSNARANIGAGTSSFSGSYTDLTDKPTIPTVNNATLTIQKNGTTVKTFTANASSNVTCNITVPTNINQLTQATKITGYSTLAVGLYTIPADGYAQNISNAINGYVQGSDAVSGFYLYPGCSSFVRKGMKIRVDNASTVVFLQLT